MKQSYDVAVRILLLVSGCVDALEYVFFLCYKYWFFVFKECILNVTRERTMKFSLWTSGPGACSAVSLSRRIVSPQNIQYLTTQQFAVLDWLL